MRDTLKILAVMAAFALAAMLGYKASTAYIASHKKPAAQALTTPTQRAILDTASHTFTELASKAQARQQVIKDRAAKAPLEKWTFEMNGRRYEGYGKPPPADQMHLYEVKAQRPPQER